MSESADSLRAQRKRETSRALTDAARRLTAQHGFAGFTVEELCADVGVSRRTFFNYFESKENAVFGSTVVDPREHELAEEFVAARGDLVDDFVAMTIARWNLLDPLEDAPAVFAVIEQEPRLIKAAFELLSENERRDIALVVRRLAGAVDAQLRAEVIVHSVGALVRMSVDQLLHHHSTQSIGDLLTRRLAIARSAFVPAEKVD